METRPRSRLRSRWRRELSLAALLVSAFACGDSRGEAMKYPVEVIATRFGQAREGAQGPSLLVVRGPRAWERLAAQDVSLPGLLPEGFDWGTRLLLWVKTSAEGGGNTEPVIVELSRDGNRVRVVVEARAKPDAPVFDVFSQPWLFAAAPRAAFDGEPVVHFEVRGQPAGTVKIEQD